MTGSLSDTSSAATQMLRGSTSESESETSAAGFTKGDQSKSSSKETRATGQSKSNIRRMASGELAGKYCMESQVGRSGQQEASVHLATRVADGVPVTIQARNKALAFGGNISEELKWFKAITAELGAPRSDAPTKLVELIETETHYYLVMEKVADQEQPTPDEALADE